MPQAIRLVGWVKLVGKQTSSSHPHGFRERALSIRNAVFVVTSWLTAPFTDTSLLHHLPHTAVGGLQVALKVVQRRLNNSHSDTEVKRLQGALHQASIQHKRLLDQFPLLQERVAAQNCSTSALTQLQGANNALAKDLKESQQKLKQKQHQLQHSQEKLTHHTQEIDGLQQLVEKLSKAAAHMHELIDRTDMLSHVQAPFSPNPRHALQAVHDAVQSKLSRYESNSSGSDFSSTELLLPVLWKPDRERHLAPTGRL